MAYDLMELLRLRQEKLETESQLIEAGLQVNLGVVSEEQQQAVHRLADELLDSASRFQRAYEASPKAVDELVPLPSAPDSTVHLRAVALAAEKLGDLDAALGAMDTALSHYDTAADAWRRARRDRESEKCAKSARGIARDVHGLDAVVARLQIQMDAIDLGRPWAGHKRAELLTELAFVYYHGGDSVESALYLQLAQGDLPDMPPNRPVPPAITGGSLDIPPDLAAYLADIGWFSVAEVLVPSPELEASLVQECYTAYMLAIQPRIEHLHVALDIAQLDLQLKPTAERAQAFRDAAAACENEYREILWEPFVQRAPAHVVERIHALLSRPPSPVAEAAIAYAELDDLLKSADPDLDEALQRAEEVAGAVAAITVTDPEPAAYLAAFGERIRADILLQIGRQVGEPALRAGEAVLACRRGLTHLGEGRRPDVRAALLLRLARAHRAVGDIRSAGQAAAEGVNVVEGVLRFRTSGIYTRDSQLRSWIGLYQIAAAAALEIGNASFFLHIAMMAKTRRTLWDKTGLNRAALETMADAKRHDRRLFWDAALAQQSAPPLAVPSTEDLQQRLSAGEVVLVHYWLGHHELAVATVAHDATDAAVRHLSEAQRDRLDQDVRTLQEGTGGQKAAHDILVENPARYAFLLPNDMQLLLSAERVFISTHGVLHGFPLHVLPVDGTPLGARVPTSYLPNPAVLAEPTPPLAGRTPSSHTWRSFQAIRT